MKLETISKAGLKRDWIFYSPLLTKIKGLDIKLKSILKNIQKMKKI